MRLVRERKPLVHQITNYVVMNETANATLALGALPVMAHAREEVAEMVAPRGRARAEHRHALAALGRGDAHSRARGERAGVPVVLDPVGAGATTYRTETAKRILDEVDVAVLRGNAGEVATLVGVEAEVRGVESIAAGDDAAAIARTAASTLGVVASVTGPVDHVSDGARVDRDRERGSAARGRHRHRLHVERDYGLLPRRRASRMTRPSRRSSPSVLRARTQRATRKARARSMSRLYDALAALDPESLDERARVT